MLPTRTALRAAAGSQGYERGQEYADWVHGLEITETGAAATILARTVYLVELEWSGLALRGHCTCPDHAAGNFCKHLVALGLAVIEARSEGGVRRGAAPAPTAPQRPPPPRGTSRPADPVAAAELVRDVAGVLRGGGELDYRRTLDLAHRAHDVLDALQELVERGDTATAQEPLLRAVTRLRRVLERADDSAGALGDACQRAAELYAEACRAGHPAPSDLARWLLRFRASSPGWPELRLDDVVEAFDDRALRVYRAGVERLRKGPRDRVDATELEQMRLELADHDSDVDTAVAILSEGPHVRYGAIVERLRSVDRDDDLSAWVDRAVEAGRVDVRHDDLRLSTDEVARDLLGRGREDDAVAVHRSAVLRATDVRPVQALLDVAAALGRGEREREWVLAALRERAAGPHGDGALLVQLALVDRDLPAAWAAADELGPGRAWQTLANASTNEFPGRAARLHRERLEATLAVARADTYPDVAATLVHVGRLMERAGEQQEFAAYVASIRDRFARRPALMAALDRRGL